MANPVNRVPAKLVIVVEDEGLVRLTASELLADAGFDVLQAADADEALRLIEARAADIAVLFTDVRMPGSMDGVKLACLTRMRWPWIRILVVSGNLTPPTARMLPECDFLSKPYDPTVMVSKIKSLAEVPLAQAGTAKANLHALGLGHSDPLPAYLS